LLKANGTANLFLINPYGIIFGPNASLSIGGSFVASTANSMKFADGTSFSATAPETTPLLTVSVPLGLQYGASAGSIINQSTAVDSSGTVVGLQVQRGKTLALVGGNILEDGGVLTAADGRVELGGLSADETVGLSGDGSLSYPVGVQRTDVSLTNGAYVDVTARGGGSIAVNARNLELSGSGLFAGIGKGLKSVNTQAGNIELSVQGEINIANSVIFNRVQSGAVGNAGNIDIIAGSLDLTKGAELIAYTAGRGDAGNVNIQASGTASFDGIDSNGNPSVVFSAVAPGAMGNGGDIKIAAGSLWVTNGAELNATTNGQGNAGNIVINARDQVTFDGGFAVSRLEKGGVGRGGNIYIDSNSLSVINGAQIISQTESQRGNAGSVNIQASGTASFDGIDSTGAASGVFSAVAPRAISNGGDIKIAAGTLWVTNGAGLNATTNGQGNAGSVNIQASGTASFDEYSTITSLVGPFGVGNSGGININTGGLFVTNGAELNTSITNQGRGKVGDIVINARDQVTFDGGFAVSRLEKGGVGRGGNIYITTGTLLLKGIPSNVANANIGQVVTATFGQGNAGDVIVNARGAVTLDGRGSDIFSLVAQNRGIGNGGNITIDSNSLSVANGARIVSQTESQGNAGSVNINASGSVSFNGVFRGLPSGAFSGVIPGAMGNGGDIKITAGSLWVTNGARLNTTTSEQGNAGSVKINASGSVTFDGVSSFGSSGAYSSVDSKAKGNGGDIDITADSLSITNGAILTASTERQGNGGNITFRGNTLEAVNRGQVLTTSSSSGKAGNITLNVLNKVTLSGSASGLFANTDANSTGDGGTIFIDPNQLTITDGAGVAVDSQGSGKSGSIQVQAGSLTLDNGASLSARANSSEGGNINLKVSDLLQTRHKSEISATFGTAGGSGNGGNIDINTRFLVALPSENSDITANAFQGSGGRINITDQGIFGIEYRKQPTPLSDITASSQLGISGSVNINTLDFVPNQGLVELPSAPRVPELIQGCQARGGKPTSRFVNTGRGGLPPNPYEAQGSSEVWRDVQLPRELTDTSTGVSRTSTPIINPARIVEAQGWIVNQNGNVELVTKMPTPSSQERCDLR